MFFQNPVILLGVLSALSCRFALAHGNTRQWTITSPDGKSETKAGQDYGFEGQTAQRLKPQERSNLDGPIQPAHLRGETIESTGPTDIACQTNVDKSGETWPVEAGSTLTAHWWHQSDFFPTGHSGVAIDYMAKCPSSGCNGLAPMDADWFKISETMVYENEWAVHKVIKDGEWSFKIPTDLAKGEYLVRHELLALHGLNGPEMYPFCLQIDLKSDGSTVPKETYKFPDIYTKHDQTFMNFQTKSGVDELAPSADKPFKFPGPPLYSGGGSGGTGSSTGSNGNLGGVGSGSDSGVSASSHTDAGSSGTGVASDQSGSAQTTASPPQPTVNAVQESPVSFGAYTAETTAASPSPSLDIKISNKQVDAPSNQDGSGNPETVEKTLPSANSGNQQGPAASGSETGTGDKMSGSGVTTDVSPAATPGADTSNESGNSEHVSDIAGGNCQEGAWRCGSKDGKTIMERCQRIDQTQYGWNMSNPDCSRMCDVSDQAHPQCLG